MRLTRASQHVVGFTAVHDDRATTPPPVGSARKRSSGAANGRCGNETMWKEELDAASPGLARSPGSTGVCTVSHVGILARLTSGFMRVLNSDHPKNRPLRTPRLRTLSQCSCGFRTSPTAEWPREESNLRPQIRSLPLYPLSYGASALSMPVARTRASDATRRTRFQAGLGRAPRGPERRSRRSAIPRDA
jgi:hypothetical protein